MALLAWVSVVASQAAATGAGLPSRAFDDAEECTEAVPAAASVAGVQDDGRQIALDVHLLLDGVSDTRADAVMAKAQEAFRPLRITLRWTSQTVSFPAQRSEPVFPLGGGPNVPTSDSAYMFQRSKAAVDGMPPGDADVVYLLTSDNITGTVAGQADCIGGIRYPTRSFAIGEEEPDRPSGTVNLCCTWSTAKIAAHEIAHLLGAHHHYANCIEGTATAVADRHAGTCTMMFNDVGLVNLHFSALEAAVIRGHVLEYADAPEASPAPASPAPTATPSPSSTPAPSASPEPTAAPSAEPSHDPTPTSTPPPTPTPTPPPASSPEPTPAPSPVTYSRGVTADLVRHLVVRGRVDAGEATSCSRAVPVVAERWGSGEWRQVGSARTGDDGNFRIDLPDKRGKYRVLAPEVHAGDSGDTCAIAASAPVRHRHR